MAIKLIIGLRNPGSAYEQTRHNAGAWFLERLAKAHDATFKTDKKMHADISKLQILQHECKMILPLTFMNNSGRPAREVSEFYRIQPQEILVAHDELDLPAGRIKLKTGGGHGGHNGLKDICNYLGSSEFHRLRVGIGHPGHKDLVLNYVLGKPSPDDREAISEAITRAIAVMPEVLSGHLGNAMNQLNA